MRARILPTDEFAEFGQVNTVVLIISINPTEANRILDEMEHVNDGSSSSIRKLYGYLQVVSEGGDKYQQDVVNLDGRLGPVPVTKTDAPDERARGGPDVSARGIVPDVH